MTAHSRSEFSSNSLIFMRFFKQKWFKTGMDIAISILKPDATRGWSSVCAAFCVGLASLFAPVAGAQTAAQPAATPSWWITPGAVSYHFKNRDQFNQTHPGFGVEYHFNNEWAVVGGTYKNSNNLWSKYGGVNWTPAFLQLGPAKFGLTGQVANNYKAARDGKPFAFAAPLIAFEGERFGANLYIIPTIRNVTGAVALQFKFAL
jgi:hypothetical protein